MITNTELDLIARDVAETLTGREPTDPPTVDVCETDRDEAPAH